MQLRELPSSWSSPAWYAGYRFVAFDQPTDFTPSDGETYTVNAGYTLAASDVSIAVPSHAVSPSSHFVLSGSVTWLGSAVSSQTVKLEASADGSVWHAIGETSTLADGSFSIETTESGTPFYRARFAGFHDAGAGDSATAELAVAHFEAATYHAATNATLTVAAPGVLANDHAVNDASLEATLVASPLHGSVTLEADGRFVYRPTHGFEGTDQFVYRAWDGEVYSAPATATLLVAPDHTPPVTIASGIDEGWMSHPATVTLSATDGTYTVAETRYTTGGPSVAYQQPFAVSAEGTTTLRYWSVNSEGSVEPTRSTLVRVDTSAPQVGVGGAGSHDAPVVVAAETTDTVSGVALVESSLDGDEWSTETTIGLSWPDRYDVAFRATDRAGNSSVTHATVIIRGATVWSPADVSTSAPAPSAASSITATLFDWFGDPLGDASAQVRVERSVDGGTWVSVEATITEPDYGTYEAEFVPAGGVYRLSYTGDTDNQPSVTTNGSILARRLATSWSALGFDPAQPAGLSPVAPSTQLAVVATLTPAGMAPPSPADCVLEQSADGVVYRDLASQLTSGDAGSMRASFAVRTSAWVRLRFLGDATHLPSTSAPVRVRVRAVLGAPTLRVKGSGKKAKLTVRGAVAPVRGGSAHAIKLVLTRLAGTRWKAYRTLWLPTDAAGGYSATLMPGRGRYRVVASAPATDDHEAAQPTSYRQAVIR